MDGLKAGKSQQLPCPECRAMASECQECRAEGRGSWKGRMPVAAV